MKQKQDERLLDALWCVRNFKCFDFYEVDRIFAEELAKSIIRMLKKLDVRPGDRFEYDERMARLRGLEGMIGVSYQEYDQFPKGAMCYTSFELDGKWYQLMDYWWEDWNDGTQQMNGGDIQIGSTKCLEHIYNYLRMELNMPKSKRRFTICRKADVDNEGPRFKK